MAVQTAAAAEPLETPRAATRQNFLPNILKIRRRRYKIDMVTMTSGKTYV